HQFLVFSDATLHHLDERIAFGVALAEKVGLPERHVELAAADAYAVLPAVVLFFHQQIEPLEPPEQGAVAVAVPGEVFFQTDEGQPALVMDGIAHAASIQDIYHHSAGRGHFSDDPGAGME